MQIKEIVLYKIDEKIPRRLSFHNSVNIISGDSATGKSALIEIIDYCLGREDCSVPAGVIRDVVSKFGVVFKFKDSEIFVVRENPPSGKQDSAVYFEEAREIKVPNDPPRFNSNLEALKQNLSNKIGISPNLYIPPRGQTREKFSATIRHASFLCFQKQDEIANSKILFHGQANGFIAQAIKDTLEYFLGAIREDRLALLQQYHIEARKLNQLYRELEESELVKGEGKGKATELLTSAINVGILEDPKTSPVLSEDYYELLKKVALWQPQDIKISRYDLLNQYQEELLIIKDKLRDKNEEINSAKLFANELEGYTDEMTHQAKRLETINLFEEINENSKCPLCSSSLENGHAEVETITKMLNELKSNLESSSKSNSNLRDFIKKLEDERESISKSIDEKTRQISTLLSESQQSIDQRDQSIRQSEIVGKVKFWLESVESLDESSDLQTAIKKLEKKVKELESLISDEEKVMRLATIIDIIGRQMSVWTKDLELEHKEYSVFFDLRKLTVGVKREDGYIPLSEMGSAENWLGYHIILCFALHLYFREHNRPVPSFLFLDQPSQVYYPAEKIDEMKGDVSKIPDKDRQSVHRLYKFIFTFAKLIGDDFQILVTDHAKLTDKEFEKALVEEWRDGNALIPSKWR